MDFSSFRVSGKFKNIFKIFFVCMHRFCADEGRFLLWAGIFYFPDSRLGGKFKKKFCDLWFWGYGGTLERKAFERA